jgi:hypothetical protein
VPFGGQLVYRYSDYDGEGDDRCGNAVQYDAIFHGSVHTKFLKTRYAAYANPPSAIYEKILIARVNNRNVTRLM